MRIATWNVNSLNVRLPHVLAWLETADVDVLCLQELKLATDKYPMAALRAAGYESVVNGQKTYNGVAIASRLPMTDVVPDIPDFADEQKRVIAATVGGVRVVCAYFPNGQSLDSDKYRYKLDWLDAMTGYAGSLLAAHECVALAGDYNIAPEDRDVHDPAAWDGQVLVSPKERAAWAALTARGLTDCFRLFEQPEKSYSWWDYRMLAFRRNMGLRIDHILASAPLAATCRSCVIDRAPRKLDKPSDHAPVVADFSVQAQ
ncbi:MAG: exodeoxyribonuclease III [Burkholderiales bacterium]|nr:exodeoxyribonuclease III [Burkholderiales bacterium]